jgi:hypothetical protein
MGEEQTNHVASTLHRAGRLGRRGLAVALAAAVILTTLGAVAYAAVQTTRDDAAAMYRASGRVRIRNSHGGDALLGMQRMLPGDRTSGKVRIGNAGKVKAKFSLGLSRMVERKGLGGGLLSMRLVLKVERLSTTRRPVLVYQGPLRRMPLLALGTFKRGESRLYRFTVLFPPADDGIDNRYQGGFVSLQFTWYARGAR